MAIAVFIYFTSLYLFLRTLCRAKNILILWDGGSTKKEIERSKKNTLMANLIANLVVVSVTK